MGACLLDSWFKIDPGEGAFYALFGLLFVFAGIVLLIVILWLIGLVMKKVEGLRQAKHEKKAALAVPSAPAAQEGISPETVAAITAAISACLEQEQGKCDFVVRRIKRI